MADLCLGLGGGGWLIRRWCGAGLPSIPPAHPTRHANQTHTHQPRAHNAHTHTHTTPADFLEPELSARGYSGAFLPKSASPCGQYGAPCDGCALFFRQDAFRLLQPAQGAQGVTPSEKPLGDLGLSLVDLSAPNSTFQSCVCPPRMSWRMHTFLWCANAGPSDAFNRGPCLAGAGIALARGASVLPPQPPFLIVAIAGTQLFAGVYFRDAGGQPSSQCLLAASLEHLPTGRRLLLVSTHFKAKEGPANDAVRQQQVWVGRVE